MDPEHVAHPTDEMQVRFDLGALVSRVAVLVDAQGDGEASRCRKALLNANLLQPTRKNAAGFPLLVLSACVLCHAPNA
jgi:hypothetical protein